MRVTTLVAVLTYCISTCRAYGSSKAFHDPHFFPKRTAIVQMFEWPFSAIARECETFLGPRMFAGVQVSPVNEHIVVPNHPWYEKYQPISYKIISRFGNESEFADMVERCNKAGVRTYVDVILNHMSADAQDSEVAVGIGGSLAVPSARLYYGVPYNSSHFNKACQIEDYSNKTQSRNCELVGLHDLDTSNAYVRSKLVQFLNGLVDLGVAGFRVDAAAHIWPKDLEAIYGGIKNLNTKFGFKQNSTPFIYQEATTYKSDYVHLGRVLEFAFGYFVSNAFRATYPLKNYNDLGTTWGLAASDDAIAFIDNHDTQRSDNILTYREPIEYVQATAFMLAFPYGVPRVMSSYAFNTTNQGSPQDSRGNIILPNATASDRKCRAGWNCEHRWQGVAEMVQFASIVGNSTLNSWTGHDDGQVTFCRGNSGFVAFNSGKKNMNVTATACLPPGTYCDIISGSRIQGNRNRPSRCSGKQLVIDGQRRATVEIPADDKFKFVAIHSLSKL